MRTESIQDFGVRMRALRAGRTPAEQDQLECTAAREASVWYAKRQQFGQNYGLTEESLNEAMKAMRSTYGRPTFTVVPITEMKLVEELFA